MPRREQKRARILAAPAGSRNTNGKARTTATATATGEIDANGKRTDAVLDGLGRVPKVWNPGWSKTDHAGQPSTEISYTNA
ncbi:hypothetical protein [Streptomyces longispororuber]|uniref:hypothetical protein n=1 Tax=Streptomyces longispororuber TaxID=68230 RepID=UPI00210DF956|nr:hypothetical protein [Streptomyces longispororuber]MCQ4210509.1 hypothetical protein [Streptomyces longispororuber]